MVFVNPIKKKKEKIPTIKEGQAWEDGKITNLPVPQKFMKRAEREGTARVAEREKKIALMMKGMTNKGAAMQVKRETREGRESLIPGQQQAQLTAEKLRAAEKAMEGLGKGVNVGKSLLEKPGMSGVEQAGLLVATEGGVAAGALAGVPFAPFTAGLSIPAGGILGGIGAAFTTISLNQRADIYNADATFDAAVSNLNYILKQANAGLLTPQEAVMAWDNEISNVYAAQRNLKTLTQGDLNKFLAPKGAAKMAQVEAFMRREREFEMALYAAMARPNTALINTDVIPAEEEVVES